MSNVLERIREQKKKQQPDDPSKAIAEKYIADVKKESYDQAHKDFTTALDIVKTAAEAAKEGYEKKIEAIEMENKAIKALLAKHETEVARLSNAVKSLNKEAKEFEVTIETLKNEQLSLVQEKSKMELDHKMAMLSMKQTPAPVIHQAPIQFPEIDFTPVRGADGRTILVTAKPRTN